MTELLNLEPIRERYEKARRWHSGVHYGLTLYGDSAEDVPALLAEVADLRAQVADARRHSLTLNAVAYRIAQALADSKGEDSYSGRPIEQAKQLIAERDAAVSRLEQLGEDIAQRIEAGRVPIEYFWTLASFAHNNAITLHAAIARQAAAARSDSS